MNNAKNIAITLLRDKNTTRAAFRRATDMLTHILAHETMQYLETQQLPVQTPLGKTSGLQLKKNIVLLPILRSGITMLPAFLSYIEDAAIGVVGLKRDEKTAEAHLYYENIPPIDNNDQIIILDPMIATGGTAVATLTVLKKKGIAQENILFVAIVSAPEGINAIRSTFANIKLIVAAQDSQLNKDKFIVPGLGDFGDRFFGTE